MSKDKYDDYDTGDIQEAQHISRRARRMVTDRQDKAKKYNKRVDKHKYNTTSNNIKNTNKKYRKQRKKRKKRTLKQKILIGLGVIVCAYALLTLILIVSTYHSNDGTSPLDSIREKIIPKLPDRTNFVILGIDEDGTRTDTIMVGCYNSVTKGLSLISIPRDTVISASAANYQTMREEFPEPGRRTMKINAVHHYGGEKNGITLAVDELETLLGIDIDYYVRVNFDAFNYLINSIGGIEYDVPIDMYYNDPTQDLIIDLKAGLQTLDGDQAENLVRFRSGYVNADLGRIALQQDFMKVFIAKVASSDTILKNPTAYLKTFFKYIKTNASISDAVKYASALKSLDTNNIQTYTLPGNAGYVGGISGYKVNEEEMEPLIYDIFEKPISEITTDDGSTDSSTDTKVIKSYDKSIQVLNGGYTNGMAAQISTMLSNKGYTVDSIGTYYDEKTNNTRIYVAEEGIGKDLVSLFDNAEVIVDPSETTGYDITVVVGNNQE